MSSRRTALDDAADILTQAYYVRCDVPPGADCPKCDWLERILARVSQWQAEESDREVLRARAKAEAERTALERLKEWREAERAAMEANHAWTEAPTPEADRGLEDTFRAKSERLLALRDAADSLAAEDSR